MKVEEATEYRLVVVKEVVAWTTRGCCHIREQSSKQDSGQDLNLRRSGCVVWKPLIAIEKGKTFCFLFFCFFLRGGGFCGKVRAEYEFFLLGGVKGRGGCCNWYTHKMRYGRRRRRARQAAPRSSVKLRQITLHGCLLCMRWLGLRNYCTLYNGFYVLRILLSNHFLPRNRCLRYI